MPLDPAMQKAVIDWITGAAAVTAPGGRWIAFATAAPNGSTAFDGPFLSRLTCTFAAGQSPAGSSTNVNAMTVTASAIATAVGWNLYESSNSAAGGRRVAYGTLATGASCASGDAPALSAGALKITLT